MDESAVSTRYARAFFVLGKEKNILPSLKDDMETVSTALSQSVDLNRMLKSPVVKPSEKIAVMKKIFQNAVNPLTVSLFELLIHHNRETFLASICRNVNTFIKKENNIKTAVLTTARVLDNETLDVARLTLEKELGTTIELKGRVNQNLIGGIILTIEDKQYDASIATQLQIIKQELNKTLV